MIENTENAQENGRLIAVPAGAVILTGNLRIPANAHGIVLLAHGSRNTSDGHYNKNFAPLFHESGLATLLVDLISEEEDLLDKETGFFRNNTSILSQRILGVAIGLTENAETQKYSIGYFGVGIVGTAALMAAAERPDMIHAVVSCGGRLEGVQRYLPSVQAPTLLIVGEQDTRGVALSQEALARLSTPLAVDKKVEIVAGATQLLPYKLADVAHLANEWFVRHLVAIL
ncbi:MAG TPA: hydrolase [Ktedonobacteraceae bacterium]|nr:hydrolase [Ktedonobacteraceae bacterium]